MTTQEMKEALEQIRQQIYTARDTSNYWEVYLLLDEIRYFLKYELRIDDYRIAQLLASKQEYIF